jgi:hypothetical protein
MISHKPADRDTEAAVVVLRIYGFIEAIVEWIEETARHFKYVSR